MKIERRLISETESYSKYGYDFKKVFENEQFAIYDSFDNNVEVYKKTKKNKFFPYTSGWGIRGWTFRSLEEALKFVNS